MLGEDSPSFNSIFIKLILLKTTVTVLLMSALQAIILEDDAVTAFLVESLLQEVGIITFSFPDSDSAISKIREESIDILLADWKVGGEASSLDVAKILRSKNPSSKIVFVTGRSSDEISDELQGFKDYLLFQKPVDYQAVLSRIIS